MRTPRGQLVLENVVGDVVELVDQSVFQGQRQQMRPVLLQRVPDPADRAFHVVALAVVEIVRHENLPGIADNMHASKVRSGLEGLCDHLTRRVGQVQKLATRLGKSVELDVAQVQFVSEPEMKRALLDVVLEDLIAVGGQQGRQKAHAEEPAAALVVAEEGDFLGSAQATASSSCHAMRRAPSLGSWDRMGRSRSST